MPPIIRSHYIEHSRFIRITIGGPGGHAVITDTNAHQLEEDIARLEELLERQMRDNLAAHQAALSRRANVQS